MPSSALHACLVVRVTTSVGASTGARLPHGSSLVPVSACVPGGGGRGMREGGSCDDEFAHLRTYLFGLRLLQMKAETKVV